MNAVLMIQWAGQANILGPRVSLAPISVYYITEDIFKTDCPHLPKTDLSPFLLCASCANFSRRC